MIRTIAVLVTLVGILVMSMPGGMCFVLMGVGVEHHHHEHEGLGGEVRLHVHAHTHDCEGHSHEEDAPEKPCDPNDRSEGLMAQAGVLKIDPVALLQVSEFEPEWVGFPDFAYQPDDRLGDIFSLIDPSPPPEPVRLCRFLI